MAAKSRPAQPYPERDLLGLAGRVSEGLPELVLRGFPYAALEALRSALDVPLAALGELVMIRPRTLARRKAEGRLAPEESDRVLRAARLFTLVLALHDGDHDAARRWMAAPSRALGGKTPLDVARTDVGARDVEALVGRLEHGVPS